MTPEEKACWDKHVLFLHKLTGIVAARAKSLRVPLEYDDLFQEASISYLYAYRSFDPGKGVRFITYLGTAVGRNLHTYLSRRVKKQMSGPAFVSLQEQISEDTDLGEMVGDDRSAEDELEAQESAAEVLGQLSPLALMAFGLIHAPPREVQDEYRAWRVKCAATNNVLEKDTNVSANFVCRYFMPKLLGISRADGQALEVEIRHVVRNACL